MLLLSAVTLSGLIFVRETSSAATSRHLDGQQKALTGNRRSWGPSCQSWPGLWAETGLGQIEVVDLTFIADNVDFAGVVGAE